MSRFGANTERRALNESICACTKTVRARPDLNLILDTQSVTARLALKYVLI